MNIEDIIKYIISEISSEIVLLIDLQTRKKRPKSEAIESVLRNYDFRNKILQILNSLESRKEALKIIYKDKEISEEKFLEILENQNFFKIIKKEILNKYIKNGNSIIKKDENRDPPEKNYDEKRFILKDKKYEEYKPPKAFKPLTPGIEIIEDDKKHKTSNTPQILFEPGEVEYEIDMTIRNIKNIERINGIIYCPDFPLYEPKIKEKKPEKKNEKKASISCKFNPNKIKNDDKPLYERSKKKGKIFKNSS